MTGFYGAMMAKYSLPDNSPISSATLNATDSTYNRLGGMINRTETSMNRTVDSGGSLLDAPTNLAFGVYDSIMLILQVPSFFLGIISDMMSVWDIPVWVQTMAYGIITVVVLFAIFSFITGRETE